MIYPNQTLIQIGREVAKKHPELASSIIEEIPKPQSNDLSKISKYFHKFCSVNNIDARTLMGSVYKSSITEKKKIFIGAMYVIYAGQRRFSKEISQTLENEPYWTSRMLKEVKFRIKKDCTFKEQVNNILKKIA